LVEKLGSLRSDSTGLDLSGRLGESFEHGHGKAVAGYLSGEEQAYGACADHQHIDPVAWRLGHWSCAFHVSGAP
jgi:hypothetical protein